MSALKLHIPDISELGYRQFLIADEETMAYNYGCGDGGGSTYHCTEEEVLSWWNYWNREGNFYAYVVRVSDDIPVGEVNIHFPEDCGAREEGSGWIGVVIEGKYRKRGYGETALRLLTDYAFNNLHLTRLLDDIPPDRPSALRIFERVGFKRDMNDQVMKLNAVDWAMTSEHHVLDDTTGGAP